MTWLWLVLGLLFAQESIPRSVEGFSKPVSRPHTMEEADVDSIAATLERFETVLVASLDGAPEGSRDRERFFEGFREAFTEKDLAVERVARRTGTVGRAEELQNHIRLVGDETSALWIARVRVEWITPPPEGLRGARDAADSLARAWPGLRAHVKVTLEWNGTDPRRGGGAAPLDQWLRLPAGHPVDAAYYQHAGRQVALLVLEALHRPDGLLDDDQRVKLEDAEREPPPALR